MGLIIGSANRQETFSDKAEPKKDQEFLVKMELQTFTFFLLAFVAFTDGAPRDMDDSIGLTKPEHAKAAGGRWEVINPGRGEALMLSKLTLDWFLEYRNKTRNTEDQLQIQFIQEAEIWKPDPVIDEQHEVIDEQHQVVGAEHDGDKYHLILMLGYPGWGQACDFYIDVGKRSFEWNAMEATIEIRSDTDECNMYLKVH